MSEILRSDYLRYVGGTSDKVYNLSMIQHGINAYTVEAEYGRFGSVLKTIVKGVFRNALDAGNMYNDLLAEKTKKGYTTNEVATVKTQTPSKSKKPEKLEQLQQNIEEGVRRIDWDL